MDGAWNSRGRAGRANQRAEFWLVAIRLLLGPLLLWQGRQVRRNIVRLPEAPGPRSGVSGEGPPLSLMLLGDSSIAGVGAASQAEALGENLAKMLAPVHRVGWTATGTTGWTTEDGLRAAETLDAVPVDIVVISLGVNDVTTETGMGRWIETYAQLLDTIRVLFDPKLIVASGLPPMGSFPALPQPLRWYLGLQAISHERRLAELVAAQPDAVLLALDFDLPVSAMARDGFHPGPAVYKAWAERIAEAVRAELPLPAA